MIRALYPGTFDPIHNGHVDIARRAAAIFDEVVVAVYHSPPKKLIFSTEERMDLVADALADVPNISVVSFTGLTVACAKEVEASVMVRGLRNVADYQFESQIGLANRHMAPEIELCCLICSTAYTYLSSTIVKEVSSLGGDVSAWVMPEVEAALNQRWSQIHSQEPPSVTPKPKGLSATRGKLAHRG
jgi:pantetheine-phosphate adenylyltransferase